MRGDFRRDVQQGRTEPAGVKGSKRGNNTNIIIIHLLGRTPAGSQL
jgi:hypothetical protein